MTESKAIRSFKIDNGMDLSITLDIDTSILTPDYAHETARFWASKDDVLAASDDDDYQAVARYAASDLWRYLIDGYNEAGALRQLHEQEGWCYPGDSVGITIRDYEIPSFYAADHEVEEL
ncbi:DUF2528 family protein [Stenotrophomonas acidaminiphila]|uniref:DUF2528 family protein n=1 Tax=Stenotrophomonas acidaminiphila TaxID=128780 RepID=UPI0015F68D02|nr:DUF2528 family protein [Stenotrophomonas acidaminiphila]